MSILTVEHLFHGFGDRAIFEDVSFRLLKGEHIGLIGANGEGKSTFMNTITGKLQPDEGSIEWSKNVRVGYLDQHAVLAPGMTIADVLRSAYGYLFDLEARMNDICAQLETAGEDDMAQMLEELGVTVESYFDLLNPALKGKIIGADPANSSSAFQSLIGMLYGTGEGDPMSDKAWEFIDGLLVNMDGKVASSSSQVYNGVANGEYAVGLSYEDPCVELQHAGEQPVKVVYPKEGVVFSGQSVQIVKNAPHLEAAQKFVDYVLSEEVQKAVAAELNLRPLREGVPTNEKMIPNDQVKLFDTYSAAYIAENKPTIVSTYIEHMEMMME